jgi:2-polyprenyl-3-methyl-5-hydroxy-6-metoxy-1,4-benzoquinol methylase
MVRETLEADLQETPEAEGDAHVPSPDWMDYFRRLVERPARLDGRRRFLQKDLAGALSRAIHKDASVLEVGMGGGAILAALPNEVRHGIDVLPEAVQKARARDPRMRVTQANAVTCKLGRTYDAIIADRIVHSVDDVQRLLENLTKHLAPDGRLFLTCFNFLWSWPIGKAEALGVLEKRPRENWFGESTFASLFALAGLEPVHVDDRVLLPLEVPGVAELLNQGVAKLRPFRFGALYRLYTLRKVEQSRPKKPTVTVVVPARNEKGNILPAALRTPLMGSRTELIFVEGGSTDGTYERIEEVVRTYQGPLTLSYCKQPGKGKADAVREGFRRATGDVLMILDADLTVPPEDLPKFYDAMVSGRADYVHGNRMVYPMESQAMRFLNKLGNAGFARLFSFLMDQPIKDTLCGTKVLWRTDYLRLAANRAYFGDFDPFGDFDLIFGATKLNLKILEIPVRYRSRVYGETNISRFRHGLILAKMSLFAARKLKFL